MGLARELRQALYDAFGPVNTTLHFPYATNLTPTATGEGLIASGAALMYGFTYSITGSQTGLDLRYVDATATGVSTPIVLNIKALNAGTDSLRFDTPIRFNKGIAWVVCATGTSAPQMHIHWLPLAQLGGPPGGLL